MRSSKAGIREIFEGEVELDESYLGARRQGKRGRGASGKVIVFGILKRGGQVYTKVIEDTRTRTLMPIIKGKIWLDSVLYTDCYRSYNALDVSGFTLTGSTTQDILPRKNNGIENLWDQAKKVLRKYNGVPKKSFPFSLKECEFRFNYGASNEQFKTLTK